jgi:hypothetical protein
MYYNLICTPICTKKFILVKSGCYNCLDAANFGNLQDLQEEDFEQRQAGEQGKCPLTMLILYAFSL